MSPWMMTDPVKESMDAHLFDTLSADSVASTIQHYTPPTMTVQELLKPPHVCPLQASTFAGRPLVIVYAGGVEISIDEFVRRTKEDGVACQ